MSIEKTSLHCQTEHVWKCYKSKSRVTDQSISIFKSRTLNTCFFRLFFCQSSKRVKTVSNQFERHQTRCGKRRSEIISRTSKVSRVSHALIDRNHVLASMQILINHKILFALQLKSTSRRWHCLPRYSRNWKYSSQIILPDIHSIVHHILQRDDQMRQACWFLEI